MSPTIDTRNTLSSLGQQENHGSSFQQTLDGIRAQFERTDGKVDVDELWKILEDYRSDPADWSKYAYYDARKYKRNLVDDHEKYNVMLLTWGPNTKSSIHDHSGAHCFMKMLEGELVESRFPWPEEASEVGENGAMIPMSQTRMNRNEVVYINDKVGLHKVENPSPNSTATSLHVYIPPYRKCKVFDQSTGQARDCRLYFYSKKGKVLNCQEE